MGERSSGRRSRRSRSIPCRIVTSASVHLKGILAERATVDVDTTFGLLRTYARNHNAPLREVATGVVEATLSTETITTPFRSGGKQDLPGRPPPPAA